MKIRRTAGGIEPGDAALVLPGMGGMLNSYSSWDIAHAAYVFEYISKVTYGKEARLTQTFAEKLAGQYASRFAEWLGHVFLNRANLTKKSKAMKDLIEGLATWVETIPDMLMGKAATDITKYLSPAVQRFMNMNKVGKIGNKIFQVVQRDWMEAQSGKDRNASLHQLPITYDTQSGRYVIPKSQMTFPHRRKLRDLGFDFDGKVWYTDVLDSKILDQLPQAAQLRNSPPALTQAEPVDVQSWFFEKWLPSNISRFTTIFNTYGKTESVPYEFKFSLKGTEVTVDFRRNIKTIEEAISELRSRYGKATDRDGWMLAVQSYNTLKSTSGMAAMHAVDMANNLEHSHGAMMEHFPPGVRSWYPKFLDFKYTADIWQMVRAIKNSDLRMVASEMMPATDQMHRIAPPKRDHRTPKGLALEIASQPGKAQKRKMLQEVKRKHPKMYDAVLQNLAEKGLKLGASSFKVALRWVTRNIPNS